MSKPNYGGFAPSGGFNANQGTFKGGYNGREQRVANGDLPPKHSGCQTGMMADGKRRWVSGWKGVGTEHVSFIANPGANGGKCNGEKGDKWVSMIADFKNNQGMTWTVNCLWDLEKKRLKFPSLGWVANPSAARGGYCGPGGVSSTIKRR